MNKHILLLLLGCIALGLSGCGDDSEDDMTDEFSASVSVSASQASVAESVGTANFTITLSEQNTSGSSISIPFTLGGTATANSDYEVSETTVIIQSNETSATIQVTITDDTDVEQDETITLSLGNLPSTISAGSTTEAFITITDNDTDGGGGTGTDIEVTYGSTTGSLITIDSWTNSGADKYIVLINTENSFSDFTANSIELASTTYIGFGEQVVYSGTSINAVSVSLLQFSSEYFFKVVPVTGNSFDNSQTASSKMTDVCVTTSTTEGEVCFEISSDLRTITANQLANHAVGNFPNGTPTAMEVTRELDLTPTYTNQAIYIYDETGGPSPSNDNFYQFGMAVNGVEFHPMGLKPFGILDADGITTGEENWEWQAKVTEEGETDLDAYGAHVTSQGNYHYHGDIVGLADEEDGSRHSLIYGFAADGFPIYYKYGYTDSDDPTSAIVELNSSFRLKSGSRTGTGTAGQDYPDGSHDGTYIQDYEWVDGLGDLDECNGRTGVTPEYPDGTYYYVITSEFPVVPNCFFGTPADDWKIGR